MFFFTRSSNSVFSREPTQLKINHLLLRFLILYADSVNLQSVDGCM